jgi:uncharacterized protein (DUF302 family)
MDVEMRYAVISIKPFEDVLEDLRFAITEQNFRITSLNRIGRAISEREEIQFPPVAVVHFCNLGLAQEILELDSNYALLMPCRVSIHERDKRIIVQTYLLPEHDPRLADLSKRINFMLKNIVNYAALQ